MKKVNETGQLTQPKSKLDEFMTKQGKTLKPAKQPIVPKDSKKVSAKERNELIDLMLKDNCYLI